MNFLPSVFLGVALFLGVVFGAQTEAWSWGPALLALSGALLASGLLKNDWRRGRFLPIALISAIGYIILRAGFSPVLDAARSDAMLALALLGCAWVVSSSGEEQGHLKSIYLVLSLTALANIFVALVQVAHPEFLWPYESKPASAPTGFFGHYNYFSNFVGGVGLLCLARALFGPDARVFKLLYAATFLGALILIPVSGSRGGSFAFGVGAFVLVASAGVLSWRKKSRGAVVFLLALPIMVLAVVFGGWLVMGKALDSRGQAMDARSFSAMADNGRLEWIKLATKVAKSDPMVGGGSRAFSWRRNHAWQLEELGRGVENESFVHNELAQTVTDYGLVGAVLVLAAVGGMLWKSLLQLFLGLGEPEQLGGHDAIASGVLAAGSFMLLQSNVSFVFHLLPSTMVLGVVFGLAMLLPAAKPEASTRSRFLPAGLTVLAASLGWFGLRATMTLVSVWPVLYASDPGNRGDSSVSMIQLEKAAKWWPGYRVQEEIARLCRMSSSNPNASVGERNAWNSRAVEAYQEASAAHPFHPGFQVNLGNALSDLGSAPEAESALAKAIELQGGLEGGFRARLCLAQHLYQTWQRRWQEDRRAGEALHEFLRARELLDESDVQSQWAYEDSKMLRKSLDAVIDFLEGAQVTPVAPSSD